MYPDTYYYTPNLAEAIKSELAEMKTTKLVRTMKMDEEIETYSPETEEQKPLPVKGDTTGFEDVLEKDGLISTRLNEKVIIQRIAKALYKNATSGLIEL